MPRQKLSPYQRICRAAKEGRGVRLSAEEIAILSHDDAIYTVATADDEALERGCADDWHGNLPFDRRLKCPGCGEEASTIRRV